MERSDDILDRLRTEKQLAENGGHPILANSFDLAIEEICRLRRFVDFANLWAWRDSKISDSERLSAIKYHPTAKMARRS